MLAQHARLAVEAGMSTDRVLLAEDGQVLTFGPDGAGKEGTVPAGRILLDRSGAEELEEVVVRDRRHLSSDGIVVPVVVLDKQTGRLQSAPEIVTRGFVDSGGHPDSSTTRPAGGGARLPAAGGAAGSRPHPRAPAPGAPEVLQTAYPAAADGDPRGDGGLMPREVARSHKSAEFLGLTAFAVALMLLISLATYDPSDPAPFFRSGTSGPARNFIGPIGAFLAELLVPQLFGMAALLLPIILAVTMEAVGAAQTAAYTRHPGRHMAVRAPRF